MAPAPPARDLVVVQTGPISIFVSSAVPDPGALPDAPLWIGRVGADSGPSPRRVGTARLRRNQPSHDSIETAAVDPREAARERTRSRGITGIGVGAAVECEQEGRSGHLIPSMEAFNLREEP